MDKISFDLNLLVISKRKRYGSFPPRKFRIDGFRTPIRLTCNKNGTGIKLFVREDITIKRISLDAAQLAGLYVAMNLYKIYQSGCSYNPEKNNKGKKILAVLRKKIRFILN